MGFYSVYLLIPKKKGRWRSVLNLWYLNHFIHKLKLHVATLAVMIPSLENGMWFIVLDMKNAYFHTTIQPTDISSDS